MQLSKALSGIFILFLICWSCKTEDTNSRGRLVEMVSALYDSSLKPFYHGVASGDPLSDRVIIWTRVTPPDSAESVSVIWQIAKDDSFVSILKGDSVVTTPDRDYTVKIDVTGLEPDSYYYYRFIALNAHSPTGRTKTTPVSPKDSVKLAIVSCSNWEFGYFNAYDRIAEKEVDAVIHLGDFIYEYGVGTYGDTTIGRVHIPPHEIVSLQDYRTRYSQYRLDQGLRNAGQRHPFISIWDDHEVANNVYTEGAENHQPDKEGPFQQRKAVARQAYYEWLPIREGSKHYRSFSFGSLADLIMLDERLEGRTKPADSLTSPGYLSEDQSMLGNEQLNWFENQLKNSNATWKLIGNQVIFSGVDQSFIYPESPRNLDSWDGYPVEKKKITSFIRENKIPDIIFITGDTHSSWAFEVVSDPFKKSSKNISSEAFAVEFATPSVSSSNWNEYASDDTVKMAEGQFRKLNPHLRYVNARDHGYLLLTLFPEKAKAEWYYVETLKNITASETSGKRLEVKKGENSLQ